MTTVQISIQTENYEISPGLIQIKEIHNIAKMEDNQMLFLKQKDEIDIPLNRDDYILLRGGERFLLSNKKVEIDNNPCLRIPLQPILNGKPVRADQALISPKIKSCFLKSLDSEAQNTDLLYADTDGCPDALISDDISLVVQKTDRFIIIPCRDNAIDLEECAKKDRKPPKGRKSYRIKIDGEKYKVQEEKMTGTEILGLVGKAYDKWSLNQKFCGGRRVSVKSEDFVDFTQKGIERFETVPKQTQQGTQNNLFPLPKEDIEYLKANLFKWKLYIEDSKKGIIISNYHLPNGYMPDKSDLMLIIPDNYPTAKIDMFYFSQIIERKDGVKINRLENESHFGKTWQRWSRHYDWRPGIDSLATHIPYIENELKTELNGK